MATARRLLSTQVRNTWELSVGQFRLDNPAWDTFVKEKIVPMIHAPLGISDYPEVEAKLYKLLLYEAGGKFEQHKDSEKEAGMFGTLVVVLPGRFEGGQLVVHDPSEKTEAHRTCTWDAGTMDRHAIRYAAFYGDCPHEVKTVTKGYRLCLTYNLVASEDTPQFDESSPSYDALRAALSAFFCKERAEELKRKRLNEGGDKQATGFDITKPDTHRQIKLVYVFDHKYTHSSLSFKYLKGKDANVAASLAKFCEESAGSFTLLLCMIDYSFDWRGDAFTTYNSDSCTDPDARPKMTLKSPWVKYIGADMTTGKPSSEQIVHPTRSKMRGLLKKEVAPAEIFEYDGVPYDTKDVQQYTGNEGAVIEKRYSSAALVVLPTKLLADKQNSGDDESGSND